MMPHRVFDVYCCLKGLYGKHRNNITWNVTPICLMWNSRTFEGMEKYVIELKICFLCVLLECCTIGGAGELLS